jgi:zinc transporter ZupT
MSIIEDIDLICTILALISVVLMLGTFTGAVFLEKQRRPLAIIAGASAGFLFGIMVLALANPYLFPS